MFTFNSLALYWFLQRLLHRVEDNLTVSPVFNQLQESQLINAIDPTNHLQIFASKDKALLHAGLSIASVYYDTGASELYHSQQTLRVVSRRLSDHHLQPSDETIGAVGLLIIHEASFYSQAEGLSKLIQSRLKDNGRYNRAFDTPHERPRTNGKHTRRSIHPPMPPPQNTEHVSFLPSPLSQKQK